MICYDLLGIFADRKNIDELHTELKKYIKWVSLSYNFPLYLHQTTWIALKHEYRKRPDKHMAIVFDKNENMVN